MSSNDSDGATETRAWHRRFAVDLNNEAWDLFEKSDRTPAETERMLHAAHASHRHWLEVGTPLNELRSCTLLAHVERAAGDARSAVRSASKAVALLTTVAPPPSPFDRAAALGGAALAHAARGEEDIAGAFAEAAIEARNACSDEEERRTLAALVPQGPHVLSPRRTFATTSPWEPVVGYSRAVRVGSIVTVAGTTAWDPERGLVGEGDAAAQARHIFGIVGRALTALGARFEDVTRVRMLLADIADQTAVGEIHAEFFKAIRPASTMVAGAVLVDPRILVEIEVDAVIGDRS